VATTAPKGSRVGFGALLVGYFDRDVLVYAGKVGTGFSTSVLTALHAQLQRLEQDHSPFTRGRPHERDVHWVKPELVAQIAFAEWTRDGLLRHPRYTGLRTDKFCRRGSFGKVDSAGGGVSDLPPARSRKWRDHNDRGAGAQRLRDRSHGPAVASPCDRSARTERGYLSVDQVQAHVDEGGDVGRLAAEGEDRRQVIQLRSG